MNWFENLYRLIDWIYAAEYTEAIRQEEEE